MLGDELKKALEPIQTSDELLEKTRRAIEQARIQQAQETLDKAVRKDARRTLFLKAMVPVACVLLIFGGLAVVLLPKLTGSKKDEGRSGVRKEHNDAVETVTADIDRILDGDDEWDSTTNKNKSHNFSFQTEATENAEEHSEESTSSEMEWYAEDTTTAPSVDTHSGDNSNVDMYKYFSTKTAVAAGEHSISISADNSGIVVDGDDNHTLTPQFKNGNSFLGVKSPEKEDTITGLYFDEETQTLYITISHFDESKYKYIASEKYLYAITFEDGRLSEEGPELVCTMKY